MRTISAFTEAEATLASFKSVQEISECTKPLFKICDMDLRSVEAGFCHVTEIIGSEAEAPGAWCSVQKDLVASVVTSLRTSLEALTNSTFDAAIRILKGKYEALHVELSTSFELQDPDAANGVRTTTLVALMELFFDADGNPKKGVMAPSHIVGACESAPAIVLAAGHQDAADCEEAAITFFKVLGARIDCGDDRSSFKDKKMHVLRTVAMCSMLQVYFCEVLEGQTREDGIMIANDYATTVGVELPTLML